METNLDFLKKVWEVKTSLPKMKKATKGFKFKYTTLEDIEKKLIPVLKDKKLGYTHSLEVVDSKNVLTTTVFDNESNNSIKHTLVIPENVELAGMNGYQSLGSALTYFRRYHLIVAFGIITDEDVDAVTPKETKKPTDYIEKVKQLIAIKRAPSTLNNFLNKYKGKMSDSEVKEIETLIKEYENK